MVFEGLIGGIAGGATVAITIKAIDKFSGTFKRASLGMKGLKATFIAGGVAAVAFGVAMTAIGVSSLKAAADFEQTEIAFTTMLGSAETAQKMLKELADFAKKTPFTLRGVERSARQLMAVGFQAEDVLPVLKDVGDIAAGLGMKEEGLQRLILNLGQVQAQGKLTGRELRDFAVAGIPLLDELSKELGVTTSEIQELVSAGEIQTDIVLKVFKNMTSAGGRFEDLMAKQAETVQGKFSNLQDTFELMQREIGSFLLPVVAELADTLLNEVLPAVKPLIPVIGTFLAESFKRIVDLIIPLIPKLLEFGEQILEVASEIMDQLFPALEELVPVLLDLGVRIFGLVSKAIIQLLPVITKLLEDVIVPLIPTLGDLIANFLELVPIILENTVHAVIEIVTSLEKMIPVIEKVIDFVGDLISVLGKLGKVWDVFAFFTPQGITSAISSVVSGRGGRPSPEPIRLTDFIIRPNGQIIQPSPQDTIMGSKNGFGEITVYIDKVQGVDAEDISEALARRLSLEIRR